MSSRHSSQRSPLLPRPKDDEFFLDCKAAFLTVFDDISDVIRSRDDLQLVIQQTGRNPSQKSITKYWKRGTESLSFDDFCDICKQEPLTSEDDLMKSFRKMDINGDGFLSLKELCKALTNKGEPMTTEEVKAIMDEVDENKDGKLDYKEFCNLVMSTTKELQKMSRKKMENKEKNRKVSSARSADGREPRPRSGRTSSRTSINDQPKPQPRSRSKSEDGTNPAVASKRLKLQEPRNLRDWKHHSRRGCFHIDDDHNIISQEYILKLAEDSSIWITIQPRDIKTEDPTRTLVDTAMFIVRHETSASLEDSLLTFTEERDARGKYGVRCDLQKGSYRLMPFTTGCKLKRRRNEPKVETKLVKKDKDGKFILTKQFKEALSEIFDLCDLTGNGSLNRQEFNLYNLRTSGEEVADDEWEVVEENVELKNGEITRKGFLQLNQMEADDNEGDTDDLWVTLRSMGYNKALILDEACPFSLDIYVEDGDDSAVTVKGLTNTNEVEKIVSQSVINKGDSKRIVRDVTLYSYLNDGRKSYVLENKSRAKVSVRLDCSKSQNVVSNKDGLDYTVDVHARSTQVALHLLPVIERLEWVVKCTETLQV